MKNTSDNHLAKRLGTYAILTGVIITIALTFIQLYFEFQLDFGSTNTDIDLFDRVVFMLCLNAITIALTITLMLFICSRLLTHPILGLTTLVQQLNINALDHTLEHDGHNSENRQNSVNKLKPSLSSALDSLEIATRDMVGHERVIASTLRGMANAIIITDISGNITDMNIIAEKLTSCTLREAKGEHINSIFSILDIATQNPIESPVNKLIANREQIIRVDHAILVSSNNKQTQIKASASPILDANNAIQGVLLLFNDISQRKIQETQYRRSLKMDTLRDITGGLAHDYNNMLGVIIGYAELMHSQLEHDPKLQRFAQMIQLSADRGTKLAQQLLSFSRFNPKDRTVVNINDLLQKQRSLMEETLTSRIELVLNLTDDIGSVMLDLRGFLDAISNLSLNANQAIEERGQFSLSTHNIQLTEETARSLQLAPGDYALLLVSDTGRGMNEEIRNKVFEPFFSTMKDKGSGLGLSQVYAFTQNNEGAITVESDLGHGCKFSLYFPHIQE